MKYTPGPFFADKENILQLSPGLKGRDYSMRPDELPFYLINDACGVGAGRGH